MFSITNFKWLLRKLHILIFPKIEIIRTYRQVFGTIPDLKNPRNWVEKMYWLLLNSDTSLWTKCADKYEMRSYVKECGLEHLLPMNYGIWDNVDDIHLDQLPAEYVLKTNHSTGTCIIIREGDHINEEQIKLTLNSWINQKYGYDGCQFHYLKIKPYIIAEQLLTHDDLQNRISPKSLIDYKFFCCNGQPMCVWVAYNRDSHTGVDMNIYDLEWKSHPEWLNDMHHYNYSDVNIPRPKCFEEMIRYCQVLSTNFPEVRIDFYVINDTPYIGELTFTSGYGFFTKEFYEYLGDHIDLSQIILDKKHLFKRLKLFSF